MRRIFTFALALGVVTAVAAPAHATIVDRGSYSWEDEWTEEEFCDFPFTVSETGDVRWRIREGKNRLDQAFFLHETGSRTLVGTHGDRSITWTEQWLFNEVRATPLGDGVFRFTDLAAGALLTVRDSSGRILLVDRGVVRTSYDFDTLSDDQPGGVWLGNEEQSFHGRFESDRAEEVVCAALASPEA